MTRELLDDDDRPTKAPRPATLDDVLEELQRLNRLTKRNNQLLVKRTSYWRLGSSVSYGLFLFIACCIALFVAASLTGMAGMLGWSHREQQRQTARELAELEEKIGHQQEAAAERARQQRANRRSQQITDYETRIGRTLTDVEKATLFPSSAEEGP